MATSAVRSPSVRRSSITPSSLASTPSPLAKGGATARSAALNRRGSVASKPSSIASNVEADSATKSGLAASLKKETEEKEELLIQLQSKDQNISELSAENAQLVNALNAAEARLTELYADQARFEEETVARLELVERLRGQAHELEKEKRELLRRYNDQTKTFDAERQSFYDNEQHLKSRIQSLVQARKTMESSLNHRASIQTFSDLRDAIDAASINGEAYTPTEVDDDGKESIAETTLAVEASEPPEVTSLRLELSTLSTSYASLSNTVNQMSAQLLDLKRVNNQLQEENESYNILLHEKTLKGHFNIMKSAGTRGVDNGSSDEEGDEEDDYNLEGEHDSLPSRSRTPLEPVDELVEEESMVLGDGDETEQDTLVHEDSVSVSSSKGGRDTGRRAGRGGRRGNKSRSPPPKGESLAGLPVAGPGLDLAAELGRAENSVTFDGTGETFDRRERSGSNAKGKKKRQSTGSGMLSISNSTDLDFLQKEVKSLKDANKALALYASKILDRILAKEGFEHVLAADYENTTPSPPIAQKPSPKDAVKSKQRPQTAIFGLSFTASEPSPATSVQPTLSVNSEKITDAPAPEKPVAARAQRRSMSFDWRGLSLFGGGEKKQESNPSLKPLNLRPGTNSVVGRKLDLPEDDEDRRERERLHATMKLMGIDKPMPPPSTPNTPAFGSPGLLGSSPNPNTTPSPTLDISSPPKSNPSRFSFFRSRSNTTSDSSLGRPGGESSLTQEALERREAETTLAALDEREKVLSAEIAKGSNGGFTELPARRQRGEGRSRKSGMSRGSGSGSTVWSAGMSTHVEESGDEGYKH